MKKPYIYFKYSDHPITEKSCSLAFLETQSIRRPASGTPIKWQSTKIYHKLIQIKWSEILHLVKSKFLRDPNLLFGFKGRKLRLFTISFNPIVLVGRWQPVAALWALVGHRG